MKKPKVSIVIPVYKPEEEVFARLKEMLKRQTINAEVIENWNMPEAKSMNTGIRKAKGEIIITLAQDCVPEDEFWLEKLIKPLENKKIVGTISDLHLLKEYWEKYDFLTRIFSLPDRKDKKNGMDMRACAFRKKDLTETGLFNEDPKMIGFDGDLYIKLSSRGKFVRANVRVFHLHHQKSFKEILKKISIYSEGNGKFVKNGGLDVFSKWIRIIKSLPFFGMIILIWGFPFKKYFYLFPLNLFIAAPLIHISNIIGFWNGFFFDKESIRNLEVLKKEN
jgi:glycosyltransferase involved in cell wall biosynthesis